MYAELFSNSTCDLLNINSMGYSNEINITRFGPSVRDAYIIHYVISGKGYFNGNCVKAGQGFLITPSMSEFYFPDKNEPWEFLWFYSYDSKMLDIFSKIEANCNTNIFNYSHINAVEKLKAKLLLKETKICSSYEMLELFLSVFKNHLQENTEINQTSNANVYLEAAINYIHTNISNTVTVKDLTLFLGISQPYLYKIFMQKFKKSPKQYIQDFKVKNAKKLLQNTKMSITQIAGSLGFTDVLTFSKFFALKIGISPQNYRKNSALTNQNNEFKNNN